jgi:hypothetical protein
MKKEVVNKGMTVFPFTCEAEILSPSVGALMFCNNCHESSHRQLNQTSNYIATVHPNAMLNDR